jgi:DNA-binding transcriptional LysR family regulator
VHPPVRVVATHGHMTPQRAEATLDLLACLSSFVRVADTGSFSAVAREMAFSQSAVTRQIAHLEEHFGVRLFHRTTRRLSLTEDGDGLLEHARHLVDDAAVIEDLLNGKRNGPTGVVRLGVSVSAAQFLVSRLPVLLKRHPGLVVDLDVNDRREDLIENRIDVAMRTGEIDDTSLIARRIGVISPILVAAPSYLERAGHPERPDELAAHSCICNGTIVKPMTWHFMGPEGPVRVQVGGGISVNNSEVASRIALSGFGIALLPGFQVLDHIRERRLVRILRGYPSPGVPIHLIYPSRRNLAIRTRVLMDFLTEQLRDAMNVLADQS